MLVTVPHMRICSYHDKGEWVAVNAYYRLSMTVDEQSNVSPQVLIDHCYIIL